MRECEKPEEREIGENFGKNKKLKINKRKIKITLFIDYT
jgi:hypothetical protein